MVSRVEPEVEVRDVRNVSVVEDEDDLLYGEAAPSLFSAALESEPAKEKGSNEKVLQLSILNFCYDSNQEL